MNRDSVPLTLTFNWRLSLLGLCLFPLLLRLGFWQLERAEEKRQLLQQVHEKRSLPPLEGSAIFSGSVDDFQQVKLTGSFIKESYWLLDNKTRQGRVGYEVIMPFQLTSGEVMLVNRGWVLAPPLRADLPAIQTTIAETTIGGYLNTPSQNKMVKEGESIEGWPIRIQQIDTEKMYQQLDRNQHSQELQKILQISGEHPEAFVTDWPIINTNPQKHQGYAVQWFSMAAVLIVALILANTNLASYARSKMASGNNRNQEI